MTKTLVLYVFHNMNERVQYFLKECIFEDDNVDFIVICNDRNIKVSVPNYVKTLHRDNIGFDFGGWSDGLLTDHLYKAYDTFIFVNSSVIGPFIPSYYKGKWTDIYLDGICDNVHLFGSTINMISDPVNKSHVQSYIFSMNKETLDYLIQQGIFTQEKYLSDFEETVWQKEVNMSYLIVKNGWNIGCLMTDYKGIDFTFQKKPLSEYSFRYMHDVMYPQYRNIFWNEYELVFIKGNRVPIPMPQIQNRD